MIISQYSGTTPVIFPDLRTIVWQRLGADLRPAHLDRIVSREVSLDELPDCFAAYVAGKVTGRTVVRLN